VLRVFDCLIQQHDYRLAVLALLVCAFGSYGAIALLNHAQTAHGRAWWMWLTATAVASGFSIWSTHFIAMLAFSPGGPTGYDLWLTLLSLFAAIILTGFAFCVAMSGGWQSRAVGGATVGGGIAAMHYTGMAAFRITGFIVWDGVLVATSIALGCALGAAALVIGSGKTSLRDRLQGALLLTLAIVSLHFTAMGAALIVRDPTVVVAESTLSPNVMAVAVALAGLAILVLSLTGVGLDRRDQRRAAVFVRDMAAAKKAAEYQNLLIAELDHRVKNVLARVVAVVHSTREGSHSMTELVEKLEGRIHSMADAHSLLSRGRWQGVGLVDVVRHELAPYAKAGNTSVDGPDVVMTADATQVVAMVLHELVTNAAKYGALSTSNGKVSVRWDRRLNGNPEPELLIEWQENGGPPAVIPAREGYGTSVIRNLIPYELGGTVDLAYTTSGLRCKIEIPSEQATGSDLSSALFTASHPMLPQPRSRH
jgi:NO-binding membrane sensor protein with MHYT domain/two-component sensor histidine kinase